jgi:hypothetical protein
MAGSCSSNKLNGCAVCAPSLVLFQLSASTSQDMVGKGCLNGDNPSPKKVYFSESSNASFNYNASDNIIDLSITDVASYNYNENITCFIDPYGAIIFTSTLSSSNSYNDFYSDEGDPGHTSAGSISCSKAERKSSCDSEPSTQCSLGGNCELNPEQGCPGDPEGWNCLQEECNESLSCTSRTRSGSVNESVSGGGPNGNLFAQSNGTYSFQRTLSSTKSLSYFYGLCLSSVSTKIGILTNNESQNCAGTKCGEGKDACWGGAACFGISDDNLSDPNATSTIAQKLKFKIGTAKEGFSKKYTSVSGKVKFYYGGTGEKTPCCNEDFDGTVVKEAGYSISSASTFKNDYLASDAGDFDNSNQGLVGQTICSCYTIDNVSFI